MIGFTDQHRQTFRIRLEQGGVRSDPYAFVIPGSRGEIYVHGPDTFGVATKGKRRKLRQLPWLKITQDGDDGFNGVFPAERLKTVARMVGAYRRPRLTPEQRATLAEHARELNQKGLNPRLGRKDGLNIDLARLDAIQPTASAARTGA